MKKYAVFICLTSSQLFISCSYAMELAKKSTYSFIVFKGRRLSLNETEFKDFKIFHIPFSTFFEKVLVKVRYGYLFKYSILFQYLRLCPEIYFFNERDTITKRFLQYGTNKKIMVEEGIGEYFYNDPFGVDDRITGACVGFPDLFLNCHPGWHGEIQLYEYKNIFNKSKAKWFANLINAQKEEIKTRHVFIGQPLNSLSQREEKFFLDMVFRLFDRYNISISIKPHPREKPEKYDYICRKYKRNVTLLKKTSGVMPLECLCFLYDIEYLYTFCSSAGINSSLIDNKIKTTFLCYMNEFKDMKIAGLLSCETELEELMIRANTLKPRNVKELSDIIKRHITKE